MRGLTSGHGARGVAAGPPGGSACPPPVETPQFTIPRIHLGSASGGAMSEAVLTALAVGGTVGGYLGYQFGNWRAASRAARATYRTQRGLRR